MPKPGVTLIRSAFQHGAWIEPLSGTQGSLCGGVSSCCARYRRNGVSRHRVTAPFGEVGLACCLRCAWRRVRRQNGHARSEGRYRPWRTSPRLTRGMRFVQALVDEIPAQQDRNDSDRADFDEKGVDTGELSDGRADNDRRSHAILMRVIVMIGTPRSVGC